MPVIHPMCANTHPPWTIFEEILTTFHHIRIYIRVCTQERAERKEKKFQEECKIEAEEIIAGRCALTRTRECDFRHYLFR